MEPDGAQGNDGRLSWDLGELINLGDFAGMRIGRLDCQAELLAESSASGVGTVFSSREPCSLFLPWITPLIVQ
jgi:hypothetical protein